MNPDELTDLAPTPATAGWCGDILFNEGEEPDALYVVLAVEVAIANKSFDGRESVVALMEPGDLFGEMGMLDGRRARPRVERSNRPRCWSSSTARFGTCSSTIPSCCGASCGCWPTGSGAWTRRWPIPCSST